MEDLSESFNINEKPAMLYWKMWFDIIWDGKVSQFSTMGTEKFWFYLTSGLFGPISESSRSSEIPERHSKAQSWFWEVGIGRGEGREASLF